MPNFLTSNDTPQMTHCRSPPPAPAHFCQPAATEVFSSLTATLNSFITSQLKHQDDPDHQDPHAKAGTGTYRSSMAGLLGPACQQLAD